MKGSVVVTGGTKGLGREIALAFAGAGYSVVVFYSSDEAAADELRAALAEKNARAVVLQHDVTIGNAALWLRPEFQDAKSLTLIHNACCPFSPAPIHQLVWPDFQRSFEVAVMGGWLCAQALIRPMLQSARSAIVTVLSASIHGPAPKGFAAYVTAKHALRGLTSALAAEYSPRGVRVFSVSPDFMDTPLTQAWDARLRESIRSASTRLTDPTLAAARLVELVESPALAGQGEDYPL